MKSYRFLAVSILLLFNCISSFAYDFSLNGIYYCKVSKSTCYVTHDINPTLNQQHYKGSLEIPQSIYVNGTTYSVIGIDVQAFMNCTELDSVYMPNTIRSIESSAFEGCTNLKEVKMPKKVSYIGSCAFNDCISLEEIELPDSITGNEYSDYVFNGCISLKSVLLPSYSKIPFSLCTFSVCSPDINIKYRNINGMAASYIYNIEIINDLPKISLTKTKNYDAVNSKYSGTDYGWQKDSVNYYSGKNLEKLSFENNSTDIAHYIRPVVDDMTRERAYMEGAGEGLVTVHHYKYGPTFIYQKKAEIQMGLVSSSLTTAELKMNSECEKFFASYYVNYMNRRFYPDENGIVFIDSLQPSYKHTVDIIAKTIDGFNLKSTYHLGDCFGWTNIHGTESPTTLTVDSISLFLQGDIKKDNLQSIKLYLYDGDTFEFGYENNTCMATLDISKANFTVDGSIIHLNEGNTFHLLLPNHKYYVYIGFTTPTIGEFNYSSAQDVNWYPTTLPQISRSMTCTTTQTTASIKCSDNVLDEDVLSRYLKINGKDYPIENKIIYVDGLTPNTEYSANYIITLKNGEIYFYWFVDIDTKGITASIYTTPSTSTSINASTVINYGDAKREDITYYWKVGNHEYNEMPATGLMPDTEYTLELLYGSGISLGTRKIKTKALVLNTIPAVALNTKTALLSAETNIYEEEENVGFEWRRYNAPETMPSNKVTCSVANGKMTGALCELNSEAYYNYRPYYTTIAGVTYYGDWITLFTGDANVFFDPTVKTYSAKVLGETSALLNGYALRGTEDIVRQGFQYWSEDGAISRSNNIEEVEVSGMKMKLILSNLEPGTTYCYRSFVQTVSNTRYGEEMRFTTLGILNDIKRVESDNSERTVVGYFNLSGEQINTLSKGINIIKYSDGTVLKVYCR